MRFALVAALAALSWVSGSLAAEKPTSAANAAGIVFGAITGREALLSHCREIDAAHAAELDRIYTAYVKSAFQMKIRTREIMLTEAKRAGLAEEQINGVLSNVTNNVVDEYRRLVRVNPSFFRAPCDDARRVPADKVDAVAELRGAIPEAVEMVNRWH
jgi:hypothetical protein